MSEAKSVPTDPGAGPGSTELRLEPHPRGASAARALVARLLTPVAPGPVVETAVLLTSELTTNAVLHARGDVVVRVTVERSLVVVEVTDHSSAAPAVRVPRLDAAGGRGLVLVEALSSRWGTRTVRGGKAVWFELPLPH
ncbi:ATP-binding protein [Pseudokineococcus basanitobsidens]|uniref:ATP-binding protein n=1 Tax=Pseudokineococcus basanitobsidens TaxID=1926649 RepID=A0ABU8RJ21_9ACTN